LRRFLLVALVALIATLATGANASTPPQAPLAPACAMPALAQKLAANATGTETVTRMVNGTPRKIVRFKMASAAMTPGVVVDLAHAIAEMTHFPNSGYDWYVRSDLFIEWLESNPCNGSDGYRFAFGAHCYRSPPGTSSPRTAVACNWDFRGALQFDHDANDWDAVWGYKEYHESNQTGCTGNPTIFHYFPDSADGSLRTWVAGRVRFVPINYLQANYRKASSQYLIITTKQTGSPGSWVIASGLPNGAADHC